MEKKGANQIPEGHSAHAAKSMATESQSQVQAKECATHPTAVDQIDAETSEAESDAERLAMQAKIAELEDSFLRAKAETENMRRRAREEVEKAHKFALERFAKHLLPVLDSLEAALADLSGDITKMREGVELTQRQLHAAIDKARIAAIHPEVGQPFDPHRHQAVSVAPAEQAPNTVIAVLQKGYLLADRVLRPALVTVCGPK